jgi:hypothetical protein
VVIQWFEKEKLKIEKLFTTFKNVNHFSRLKKAFWSNGNYFWSHQILEDMKNIFLYFMQKQTELKLIRRDKFNHLINTLTIKKNKINVKYSITFI